MITATMIAIMMVGNYNKNNVDNMNNDRRVAIFMTISIAVMPEEIC